MFSGEVAVVAREGALRAELAAQLARGRFRVLEVNSTAEAVRAFSPEAQVRVLLAIFTQEPSRDAVQELLDASRLDGLTTICAVRAPEDAAEVARLSALGLLEVFPLGAVDAPGLGAFVMSCVLREQARRRLVLENARVALERDLLTAMSVAVTRQEILQAFLQALLAWGATGAVCWERGAQGATRVMEVGVGLERSAVTELPLELSHPAVAALNEGESHWFETGAAARSAYPDFLPLSEQAAIACLPSAYDGEALEAVAVVFPSLPDDTARRMIERLCVRWGEALRRARTQTQLEQEREQERRLLAVIAHDLRSPLNTIVMSANLLLQAAPAPQVAEAAQRMWRAGRNGFQLVEDLLTFSQSHVGGVTLSRQERDVFALVSHCVSDARLRALKRRTVELELPSSEAMAWIDPVRIEQAVGNLISNALSYSPEGSVVRVRGSSDELAVYIDVENRGAALGPERIAEIFQPIKERSVSGERGSLGLGLFIVDKVMEAHGGRVWVERCEPEGVRFCLQVPRQPRSQDEKMALVSSPRPRPRRAPSKPFFEPGLLELKIQFRAEALHRVLQLWCEARGKERMPHPLSLDRSRLLAYLPDMISAEVSAGADGQPVFSWLRIGPRLERRLKGTLNSGLSAGAQGSHAQYQLYRQCYEQRRPTYDYLRERGASPFSFERLLLPMTRQREHSPSEILGLIVFSETR